MELLVTFVVFNVINVIIQTIKSICTIKCNKWIAAIVNAVAYGLYTYILVLTVCELPLFVKIITVALANLIGVFVVKYIEEKKRKDKLWKIEATIYTLDKTNIQIDLTNAKISHNCIDIGVGRTVVNCYSATSEQSLIIKNILEHYNAKYFVSESKTL